MRTCQGSSSFDHKRFRQGSMLVLYFLRLKACRFVVLLCWCRLLFSSWCFFLLVIPPGGRVCVARLPVSNIGTLFYYILMFFYQKN